ncbi:hypothetical protein CC80DRAFT_403650, partial [Byssothecium circinans]
TGANEKHCAKHTAVYRALFSTTYTLVIATTAKYLYFRSSARKQTRVQHVVEQILSYDERYDIFTYAFSEGGSNKAVELTEA